MKKFYSLAIAAVLSVSAISAQTQLSGISSQLKPMKNTAKSTFMTEAVSIDAPQKSIKTIDIADLTGDYTLAYTSALKADEANPNLKTTVQLVKVSGNNYKLVLGDFEIACSFSVLRSTLTFEANQDLGYNEANKIQVYFYHSQINETSQALEIVDTPLTATVGESAITFGELDAMAIGNVSLGYFFYGYNLSISEGAAEWVDGFMPAEGWVDAGTGIFVDGWQIGAYGVNPADFPYEVQLEKNVDEPGLYRIVNPYGPNCPIYSYNADTEASGYILFSIADPAFVMVYPYTYSGLTDSQGAYLNTNPEGYFYILSNGSLTKEEIVSETGITPSSFDEATGTVTFRNNRFGTTAQPDKLYFWTDESGNAIVYDGSLVIKDWAGIEAVGMDKAADAPVEYFNLQGMRVDNVEGTNGIYIRRQGDKVSKVYVK